MVSAPEKVDDQTSQRVLVMAFDLDHDKGLRDQAQIMFSVSCSGVRLLSVPLPFLAGLVFALTLYRSLQGVDTPGSRRYFHAFLTLYALQGIGVGLRFGYGVESLSFFLPITASAMPPLAYLAFRGLTDQPVVRPWLHAFVPVAVALAANFLRDLVDPLLLVIFLGYAVALYRLTVSGLDAMPEASLQRALPTIRAARLTAGLMLFFALSDAGVALYTTFYGAALVPEIVSLMNMAAMLAVALYYFAPTTRHSTMPGASPSEGDRLVLAKIQSALDHNKLYADENLSMAKLARKAGVPPREVSLVINRATGFNLSQFVNNRRVEAVCRLLYETDRTLMDIMFDAGFATKSNFNREFRRVTGITPSQWRVRARAKRSDIGQSKSVADIGHHKSQA